MNLKKLFEMQKVLDDRIIKEHGLEGQDLLPKKILALQVELGECANEWREFKFWSKDQKPRTTLFDEEFDLIHMESMGLPQKNPLLEEYVDCIHFILSIGNGMEINISILEKHIHFKKMSSILDQFMWINKKISVFYQDIRDESENGNGNYYVNLINSILGLGEMLGFTWEQIETAYMDKNSVNHDRQTDGY